MKLLEISPYLRIILRYSPIQKPMNSYSLDNRLFYIRKGEGSLYINGERHAIAPDSLFMWQRGTAYRFDFKGPNDVISLNFDYTPESSNIIDSLPIIFDTTENREKIASIEPIHFDDCPELNRPIILYNAISLFPAIKEILNYTAESQLHRDAVISAKLKILVTEILRLQSSDGLSQGVNAKVQRVLEYIRSNYRENLTNERLAEQVGYHPYYLNSVVKKVTGTSLHQYLINCRLCAAEKMLIATDASVADIGESVGFSSTMVFLRNFKQKNKTTPNKYREMARQII